MSARREAGFTLIEVLAALLIFSVAILGMTSAAAQSARAFSRLDDKMIAGIVADNQIVLARTEPRPAGIATGETEIMGRTLRYSLSIAATDLANFERITVQVFPKTSDDLLLERTAFRAGAAQ